MGLSLASVRREQRHKSGMLPWQLTILRPRVHPRITAQKYCNDVGIELRKLCSHLLELALQISCLSPGFPPKTPQLLGGFLEVVNRSLVIRGELDPLGLYHERRIHDAVVGTEADGLKEAFGLFPDVLQALIEVFGISFLFKYNFKQCFCFLVRSCLKAIFGSRAR